MKNKYNFSSVKSKKIPHDITHKLQISTNHSKILQKYTLIKLASFKDDLHKKHVLSLLITKLAKSHTRNL